MNKVMKANELMIGDWVMVNDIEHTHPLQVTELYIKCGTRYATLYWDGMPDNVNPETLAADVDKVLPIPLTPEILEKNGFKRDPLWHHCDKDLDNYSISVQLGYANRIEYIRIAEKGKDNVIPSERTKLYLPHIKYVHQFQQALRLCRIDKKFEL